MSKLIALAGFVLIASFSMVSNAQIAPIQSDEAGGCQMFDASTDFFGGTAQVQQRFQVACAAAQAKMNAQLRTSCYNQFGLANSCELLDPTGNPTQEAWPAGVSVVHACCARSQVILKQ